MRIFGGQHIIAIMNSLNIEEDMAIENIIITRQIESNQKKVETFHFDARKSVLEYDDVMNLQREKFYAQRNKVLENTNLHEDIIYMIEREVDRLDLEKLEFHTTVRNTFLELSRRYPERYVVIDASKSMEEVAKDTIDAILSRLCK